MAQQYHLPLPRREAMGLEDFLPAPCNADAIAWLIKQNPSQWSSHALVLWGPEGSGKTHLLTIWAAQNEANVLHVGDPVLSAIVDGSSLAPAFALDDVDKSVGDAAKEEWLQHFYNATKAGNIPVLITARTPPSQWGLKLRDIETRLKSCPTIRLKEPDDDLMRGLLLKLFADRQLMVETGVVEYLAQRVDRTGAALRQLVETLDIAALESGRKISIPFAQKLLMQTDANEERTPNS